MNCILSVEDLEYIIDSYANKTQNFDLRVIIRRIENCKTWSLW